MKKILLTFFATVSTSLAFSQSIPNGNFENWNTKSFEDPLYWACSNDETHGNGYVANNAEKTTDAKSGSFAIKLTTVTNGVDPAGGYFADGNPGVPPQGGMPYNQMPTGIKLWHKYNIMPGDTGLILVQFKKNS